jgi:hypothetical protein
LLIGAAIAPPVLPAIAEWLHVRRLPPGDRRLTLREIYGFLALTQTRSRTVAESILGSIETVGFAGGLLLGITSGQTWLRVTVAGYCVLVSAYLAWRAYRIHRLQLWLTPPAARSISMKVQ